MSKHICGIDFGTSNSAIAAPVNGRLSLIPLENDKDTIPSALFFNVDEKNISYGRQAIEEYLDGYAGRLLRSLISPRACFRFFHTRADRRADRQTPASGKFFPHG